MGRFAWVTGFVDIVVARRIFQPSLFPAARTANEMYGTHTLFSHLPYRARRHCCLVEATALGSLSYRRLERTM